MESQPQPLPTPALTQQLKWLADKLVQRGLAAPAVFFLELHKPLCGLAAGLHTFSAPMLSPLVGRDWVAALGQLFESRQNLEAFICYIEQQARAHKVSP
jgi:hypothetical protein